MKIELIIFGGGGNSLSKMQDAKVCVPGFYILHKQNAVLCIDKILIDVPIMVWFW